MYQKVYQKLQTREGLTFIASIALIVMVIGFIMGDFPQRRGYGQNPSPTITVSGKGEAVASPDIASFSFNVSKDAPTMAEAQTTSSELANTVVAQLKAAGIEAKDIKTEGFNAYPKYENRAASPSIACAPGYCDTNPVIVGYTVSTSYTVKVRNLDQASGIAKLLTDANVSSLSGPNFEIDSMEDVSNLARARAIADAKVQAKVLARQLGVQLVEIVDFQEVGNGGYPVPMYARASVANDAGAEKVSAPSFEPGQTDVTSNITITYRIR